MGEGTSFFNRERPGLAKSIAVRYDIRMGQVRSKWRQSGLAARVFAAVMLAGNSEASNEPVRRQSLRSVFWTAIVVYVSLFTLLSLIDWPPHRDRLTVLDSTLTSVNANKSVADLRAMLGDTDKRSSEFSHAVEYVGKMTVGAAFAGGVSVLLAAIGRAISHLWRRLITRISTPHINGDDARVVGALVFVAINALQKAGDVARVAGFFILTAFITFLLLKLQGLL